MATTTNTTRRSAMIRCYVDPDADGQAMPAEDRQLLWAVNDCLCRMEHALGTFLHRHGTDCQCEPCIALTALANASDEAEEVIHLSLPASESGYRDNKEMIRRSRSKQGK